MGKHERLYIEQMEKSVVSCLNEQKPLIHSTHKWYKHMQGFVHHVKENYPETMKAYHIGNEYGKEVGDIKLIMRDDSTHFLELKASETPFGRGTLANISQNAITEYELLIPPINGTIQSWSDFREANCHRARIKALLDHYRIGQHMEYEDKARFLRDKSDAGDSLAKEIVESITELANKDKKDYINYIRAFSPNEENIIKFVFCLVNGIHTKGEIKLVFTSVSSGSLRDIYQELTTLYANTRGEEVVITEKKGKMKSLLTDNRCFSFLFPEEAGQSKHNYIVCYDKRTGAEKKLLSFVFHWKNVFQGIQTPCINVFLASYFEE
jgi:hypothetical protein